MKFICQKIKATHSLHKKNHTHKENGEKIKIKKETEGIQKETFKKMAKEFEDACAKVKKDFPEFDLEKIREKIVTNKKKSNIGFLRFVVKNKNHKRKFKIILEIHLHVDDDGQPDRVFACLNFFEEEKINKEKSHGEIFKLKNFFMEKFFVKLETILRDFSHKNYSRRF